MSPLEHFCALQASCSWCCLFLLCVSVTLIFSGSFSVVSARLFSVRTTRLQLRTDLDWSETWATRTEPSSSQQPDSGSPSISHVVTFAHSSELFCSEQRFKWDKETREQEFKKTSNFRNIEREESRRRLIKEWKSLRHNTKKAKRTWNWTKHITTVQSQKLTIIHKKYPLVHSRTTRGSNFDAVLQQHQRLTSC